MARRADACAGQIYRWRQETRGAGAGFTEVVVTPSAHEPSTVPCTGTAIEVEFDGVTFLRIAPSTPPELAAAVVGALRR